MWLTASSRGLGRPRALAALATLALIVLLSTSARAEPQATAGLTLGAALTGKDRQIADKTVFQMGVRGDVLFGRSEPYDLAFGPYMEVSTHGFSEIQFGGGASLLLPVIDFLPIVVSAGAYGRKGDDHFGVEPGIAAELFWGTRSYNFHANYVMTAGLLGQMRYGLGESRETSIVIGAQLDFLAMSLPFLFIINAIRGGSSDTDPVK